MGVKETCVFKGNKKNERFMSWMKKHVLQTTFYFGGRVLLKRIFGDCFCLCFFLIVCLFSETTMFPIFLKLKKKKGVGLLPLEINCYF